MPARLTALLAAAIGTPPQGFTDAALAHIAPDGMETAWAWGGAPATARMRVASISKMATASAIVASAALGRIDLDAEVAGLLDWHGAPGALRGVRLRHLLSHTSGLTDHAGYIVDPPDSPLDLIARAPAAKAGTPPGRFFRYANLNYILAGIVLERAWNERFDRILRRLVLDPAHIGGGFNWAGVADGAPVLPVAQWTGGALVVQADAPDADWGADLIWRNGRGVSLDGYRVGRDTTLFSPHAGLRASVLETARLARFAAGAARNSEWRFDGANGVDCDGLFTAFGLGLTIYRDHPHIPGHLLGHAGHALGFTGGAWHDADDGATWAYALNGSPDLTEGSVDETFYSGVEAEVMARLGTCRA